MDAISPRMILALYSEAVQMPVRCHQGQGRAVLYCPLSGNLPKDDLADEFLLDHLPADSRTTIYVSRCGEVYGILPIGTGEDSEIYITGPGRLRHIGNAEFRQLYQREGFLRLALERKMVFNSKMERVTIGRMKVLLGMLYYMRTGRILDLTDVKEEICYRALKPAGTSSPAPEQGDYYNTSGAYENALVDIVSHGEVKRLKSFFQEKEHVSFGNLSEESLRHQKNLGIVTVTIVSRAAISGGLNEEYAYHLSDHFIRELESLQSLEDLDNLTGK